MKAWKEIGKGAVAFAAWMVIFIVLALIDESIGYWITDHKATQIMVQGIIQGVAVIVLLQMNAKVITAISLNIFLLLLMWMLTEEGLSHSMAIVMMLSILPIYSREKGGAE